MRRSTFQLSILCVYLLFFNVCLGKNVDEEGVNIGGSVVKREERRVISTSENGEVSRVKVNGEKNGSYLVEFITMEPNTLFLPVLLHADMLFYVQSGNGRLSYIGEEGDADKKVAVDLSRGDVFRLEFGSVFFIESSLNDERRKLRICSIFAPSDYHIQLPSTGPYSSIPDMLLGFDDKILQAAFRVPEEIIEELKSGSSQPFIIHREVESEKTLWENKAQFISNIMSRKYANIFDMASNKKRKSEKTNVFNFLDEDHDFENCNGWSTAVTSKKLKTLKHSDMGMFMVNLTKGSMMGPHWNPRATEIAIVVQGEGMVRVVCANGKDCVSRRFKVEEGDIFVTPRFHPMAQMSFNNDTFVFVGFSTSANKNHPQYLAGKSSVLQTLDRDILAMSFDVANATIDQLLAMQGDSIILECTSCAEDEEMKMIEEERKREEEEAAREREEEARREEEEREREEEEAKRKEEEERKREEEEEERKREEEEARRQEEEKRRREEEEREREEEEAKRKEDEERKREEEEAERKREEEEARRQEEEKRRREEEKRKREEEEAKRAREEEEAKRQEEEKRKREQQEEEEEEEEREREQQQEEARRAREEEARREREEEEAKRREEEKREREQREEEEEEEREREQQQEEEEARRAREEETRREREEEEEARRQEEEQEEGRQTPRREEETDWRKRREERAREEEEAARRQEGDQGGDGRKIFIKMY